MTHEHDEDPGEPIEALAELRLPASKGFLAKVRGRIDRRTLASHLLDATWSAPALVLLEFLNVLFGMFGRSETDRGGK